MSQLPDYIQTQKHDDWIWPLSYIPRRWTSYEFPMPPNKVCGTQKPNWIWAQPGYPLAPDACVLEDFMGTTGTAIQSMEPVGPVGTWSIQSCWLLGRRIPCYITGSKMVLGKRLYFNFGLKPDVTYNPENGVHNWHWAFPEMSLTWL